MHNALCRNTTRKKRGKRVGSRSRLVVQSTGLKHRCWACTFCVKGLDSRVCLNWSFEPQSKPVKYGVHARWSMQPRLDDTRSLLNAYDIQ
eukprot:scaffold20973_cov53-Phaeocystis_antarctica.AAC.10